MSLSWRVQNIVVIGRIYLKLERSEFSSNFEFDRNMLSGTGARSSAPKATDMMKYFILSIIDIDQENIVNESIEVTRHCEDVLGNEDVIL